MSVATATSPGQEREERNDEKNLTILEHLQELRQRLMVCGLALVVAMTASFSIAAGGLVLWLFLAWAAIAVKPAAMRAVAFVVVLALAVAGVYSYTVVPGFWNTAVTSESLEWLKEPAASKVDDFELVFTQPLEYWTTFFRVSLMIGITLAMPVFLWQILAFVGPGLTKNEKRWAYPIVGLASVMFVLGCAFAYYVELPPALNFLLDAGDVARPLISVKSYVDFATRLMLVTGIVFETPLLIVGLAKIGIVTSSMLWRWWRFAFLGAFVLSAIVTPSIDPITQTLVALPMIVLYFFGIIGAKLVEKTPIIPRA